MARNPQASPFIGTASSDQKVGVFWDIEGCPPPLGFSGHDAIDKVEAAAAVYGEVGPFKAYIDSSVARGGSREMANLCDALGVSGSATLVTCPSDGPKSLLEGRIIADIMAFALDNAGSSLSLFVLSSNAALGPALLDLKKRKHKIVLVSRSRVIGRSLIQAKTAIVPWEEVFQVSAPEPEDNGAYDLSPSSSQGSATDHVAIPRARPRYSDTPSSPPTTTNGSSESPGQTPSSPATTVDPAPPPVPPEYLELAGILEWYRIEERKTYVSWSDIGCRLLVQDPLMYQRVNTFNLTDFLLKAHTAGIARIRSPDPSLPATTAVHKVVSLNPIYYNLVSPISPWHEDADASEEP